MKLSKLCNGLATLLIVLVVLVAIPLVVPKAFGYQLYGILSGSMEPTYPVGSVVYVDPVSADEVNVGDAITFKMAADSDVVATHRIIEKNEEAQTFTTKGDNNESADSSPVSYQRLIGKVVFCIPMLGFIAQFVQSGSGIIACVCTIIIVFALWFIADTLKKNNK